MQQAHDAKRKQAKKDDAERDRPPQKRLLENIHSLKRLGVEDVLQAEILAHLVNGPAAASDLASEIFCNKGSEAPSRAQYMRVARALGGLERKGYVARSPFGKQKPYRLTGYARELLAAVAADKRPSSLISRKDIIWCVLAMSSAGLSLKLTGMELPSTWLMGCWLATGLVSGLCAARLARILGRVW